jgi:hypothetical protein
VQVPATHEASLRWDIGPFTLWEAYPVTATQEWHPEVYFVALAHQNRWLSDSSYPTMPAALRAMADFLEKHS